MSVVVDEVKLRINRALEQTGGDRVKAAEILKMDPNELRGRIHNCKELKWRWTKSRDSDGSSMGNTFKPPTEIEGLEQNDLPPVEFTDQDQPSADEMAMARLIQGEDKRVANGLDNLPANDAIKQLARDLMASFRGTCSTSIEIGTAGLVLLELLAFEQGKLVTERLSKVRQRLLDMDVAVGEDRDRALTEEASLNRQFTDLGHLAKGLVAQDFDARKIIAWIESNQRKKKSAKPGFSSDGAMDV